MTEFEKNLLNKLIQDKVITEDIALVAEQMQLEKGGRIDTNLLDIRAIDEDTLIKYLEIVSRLKPISIDKIEDIPKEVISLFPARLAVRYRLVPFKVEKNTLYLIISDPTDIALLEEISFLLGMDVKPFIAPDLWIEHLLCKHYRVEPNKRYEELYREIREKRFELKSEETIKRDQKEREALKRSEAVADRDATKKVSEEVIEKGSEKKVIEIREIDLDIVKPYTYSREEALEDIKGIKNRDAILFFALKYAYQYFDFCAILIFHKDRIRGFNFLGPDRSIEKDFKSLELNLNGDNIFRLVKDTGAHFLGVMSMTGENELFIRTLKRPYPPNVLIIPVTIAGKIVGVFYADNGESLVRGEDVPHILTFFNIVSYQLQELIKYLKYNQPPYKIVFRRGSVEKKEETHIEQKAGEEKSGSTISEPEELSPPSSAFEPEVPASDAQKIEPLPAKEDYGFTEEMVKELSQYIEESNKAEDKPESGLSREKEAPKEEKSGIDDISKKEEEYRINLLLDTLEQSPNAINSPVYDQLIEEREKALPYIAKRFPGKLKIDLLMQSSSDISDVEEHSNLLQLIVGIGKDAIPYIAPLIKSENPTIRFYAVFVFSKLRYPEAIPYLIDAIFDKSPKISLIAIEVLNRYRTFSKFSMVLSRLRSELVSSDIDRVRIAALSLGQFKDTESILPLIKLLSSKSEQVRDAALNSLRDICKEDFGTNQKEWTKWWQKHSKIPRILWMIEGLSHKDENIRYLSISELREITGEFFGYFHDAPKKERDKAIQRWKEWWEKEGEKRFAKEG